MGVRPAAAQPDWLLAPLLATQLWLGARVVARLIRTAGGERIAATERADPALGRVSVLVPVLDERARLAPCLEGLIAQGAEVAEILVVDGGSRDGTPELVAAAARRDPRLRLLDASPLPAAWSGKVWGLEHGLRRARPDTEWLLTIDADVCPRPGLTRALVAHAAARRLAVLSVATTQELSGPGDGLVHPALLATLVYRFGIPGWTARRVDEVQANGQCMLLRRSALECLGGFRMARGSACDDVTLARHLAARGERVGFYESDAPVSTRMYTGAGDAWRGWVRTLPLRDGTAGSAAERGLLEVALVQALPLPLLALLARARPGLLGRWLRAVNLALGLVRLGVLVGTRRAYARPPWTYWLSPLCDLPAALALWRSAFRRRHTWRGRVLVIGGS